MMGAMAAALSPQCLALVTALAQHVPTREQAQALLMGMGDDLAEDRSGEAMWSAWLWGPEDQPRPPQQSLERLRVLQGGLAAHLSMVQAGSPLQMGAPPTQAPSQGEAVAQLQGLIDHVQAAVAELSPAALPSATGAHGLVAHEIILPEQAAAHVAPAGPKGRLIGFPLLLVAVALGLVGYIVVLLLGGLG